MTWLIVLAVLVVGSFVGRMTYRRWHASSEPTSRQPLDVRDLQGGVETRGMNQTWHSDFRD